jgi:hypothetical protein
MALTRVVLVVLVVLGLAGGGFYYIRARDLERQGATEKKRADELQSRIQQWEGMAYDVWLKQQQGHTVNDSLLARTSFLDPLELDELERKGLKDPVMALKTDLIARPELIPYEPTLGGTMRFTGPASIILLAGGFAHARFEDGHVGGTCVLEFAVKPTGEIEWKRVAARLD